MENMLHAVVAPLLMVVGAIVAYAFVVNRIGRAIQPLRLRFAEKAETLIGKRVLPEPQAWVLKKTLDEMFNGWAPWAIVVMIPLFAIEDAICGVPSLPQVRDTETARRYEEAILIGALCVMAQSPIALAIVMLEGATLVVISGNFRRLRRAFYHLAGRKRDLRHAHAG